MNLLSRLQPLFLARPRREKILEVLILVVVLFLWSASLLGRTRSASRELSLQRETARSQKAWLDNEDLIEGRYASAMSTLSSMSLPSRSEVMARLEELARKHAISPFEMRPPISERKEGLTFHTFSMSMQRVEYGQLESFYNDVQTALPSVNLFEVRISANINNRAQLSARLSLVAIELNR